MLGLAPHRHKASLRSPTILPRSQFDHCCLDKPDGNEGFRVSRHQLLANSASCRPPNMMAIPPPSSTSSTPSNPEAATDTPDGTEIRTGFSLPPPIVFGYTLRRAVVVVEGAPV